MGLVSFNNPFGHVPANYPEWLTAPLAPAATAPAAPPTASTALPAPPAPAVPPTAVAPLAVAVPKAAAAPAAIPDPIARVAYLINRLAAVVPLLRLPNFFGSSRNARARAAAAPPAAVAPPPPVSVEHRRSIFQFVSVMQERLDPAAAPKTTTDPTHPLIAQFFPPDDPNYFIQVACASANREPVGSPDAFIRFPLIAQGIEPAAPPAAAPTTPVSSDVRMMGQQDAAITRMADSILPLISQYLSVSTFFSFSLTSFRLTSLMRQDIFWNSSVASLRIPSTVRFVPSSAKERYAAVYHIFKISIRCLNELQTKTFDHSEFMDGLLLPRALARALPCLTIDERAAIGIIGMYTTPMWPIVRKMSQLPIIPESRRKLLWHATVAIAKSSSSLEQMVRITPLLLKAPANTSLWLWADLEARRNPSEQIQELRETILTLEPQFLPARTEQLRQIAREAMHIDDVELDKRLREVTALLEPDYFVNLRYLGVFFALPPTG